MGRADGVARSGPQIKPPLRSGATVAGTDIGGIRGRRSRNQPVMRRDGLIEVNATGGAATRLGSGANRPAAEADPFARRTRSSKSRGQHRIPDGRRTSNFMTQPVEVELSLVDLRRGIHAPGGRRDEETHRAISLIEAVAARSACRHVGRRRPAIRPRFSPAASLLPAECRRRSPPRILARIFDGRTLTRGRSLGLAGGVAVQLDERHDLGRGAGTLRAFPGPHDAFAAGAPGGVRPSLLLRHPSLRPFGRSRICGARPVPRAAPAGATDLLRRAGRRAGDDGGAATHGVRTGARRGAVCLYGSDAAGRRP